MCVLAMWVRQQQERRCWVAVILCPISAILMMIWAPLIEALTSARQLPLRCSVFVVLLLFGACEVGCMSFVSESACHLGRHNLGHGDGHAATALIVHDLMHDSDGVAVCSR